jgi:hypothetical protein
MILLCSSGRAGYEKAPVPSGIPSLIFILPSFYPDCNTNLHIRPAAAVRIQGGASKKTFTAASRAAAARRNAARSRAEHKNFSFDCALFCTENTGKSGCFCAFFTKKLRQAGHFALGLQKWRKRPGALALLPETC